uniref:Cytokinin riboside 5'-monophosphate phosphoribohydrolase n=2 Tax=unclassified Prevotella TaxID=2638335 RepID=A0AB33JS79_9BACT
MKITVFCSANNNIDPDFFKATEELGAWMAANRHTLVYGGTDLGLMECIAKTVHEHGGQTIGVVPTKVEEHSHTSKYNDVEIPCDNLNDRKQLMLLHTDIAIALPGGVGTLDEIFSMAASKSIGYHDKRVVLYNIKGFWDKTIELLDDMQQRGFIRGDYHRMIIPVSSLDELKTVLSEE